MSEMREGMIPTINRDEIAEMVRELAREIERDYENKELVMICPLKGSVPFYGRSLPRTQATADH